MATRAFSRIVSSLQHLRISALATTCALLILGSLTARSADVVTPAQPVTARPPLVAVPAPPMTKAMQTRMHQCTAAAHSKQLHGKERDAYMRTCAAAKHAPTPPQQTAKAAPATPR
jgi:hypothetical protein